MSINWDSLITASASVGGMLITGLLGLIVAKHNRSKDVAINDRRQLSRDEQQFRSDVFERMKMLQEQVDKYQQQVDNYHQKSIELEDTVALWKNKYLELDREWRTKYTEMEIENKHLTNKVYVLELRLRGGFTDKGGDVPHD